MKIEATLDAKGHLEFVRPLRLRLRHARVRVQVTVPDDEIQAEQEGQATTDEPSPEIGPRARSLLEELDAIRHAPRAPEGPQRPWTARHKERLEAADERAALRAEQGRLD